MDVKNLWLIHKTSPSLENPFIQLFIHLFINRYFNSDFFAPVSEDIDILVLTYLWNNFHYKNGENGEKVDEFFHFEKLNWGKGFECWYEILKSDLAVFLNTLN